MFGKDRKKGVGQIFLGFAILMAGMDLMSGATAPLADAPWFGRCSWRSRTRCSASSSARR